MTTTPPVNEPPSDPNAALRELIPLFLRLGITAFGGPAAHIAMFRDEAVTRRGWLSDERFLDLLGATNLIPGPNSTEMAIHIGYERAGWRGLVAAGLCFILPAALIVLAFAVLYVNYGATPGAEWLLYGIKPVIIAVIAQAIRGLFTKAVKNILLGTVGAAVLALYLLGVNEIALLFGGGLLMMAASSATQLRRRDVNGAGVLLPLALLQGAAGSVTYSSGTLFLTFLKIGAVLYGSGYVLLAFLRADFVERLGWLTNQQLLDAVAVGQFTPGPVFTTATFIGYLLGGFSGALLATVGIFLPSFIFVLAVHPFIARLRASPILSALLDGVNVAALGLMAAVTIELGQDALTDVFTVTMALVAALLLIRYKVNSTWLIIGGGGAGVLFRLLGG